MLFNSYFCDSKVNSANKYMLKLIIETQRKGVKYFKVNKKTPERHF